MRTVALIAASLLVSAPALAQEKLTAEDFVRQAVEDNRADVEFGRMVRNDPALPPGVHQVGRMLERSSTQMNGALAKLAQDNDVRLGTSLAEQDRQMIQRLSQMQGAEFTREYLQFVINDLERDIKFYQDAVEVEAPDVSQFAQETLPVLQTTLAMAEKVWEEQVAQAELEPGRVEPPPAE
ncbi:MAG: DUF4142 domain-containing protein [Pseudomonadota bacterium]